MFDTIKLTVTTDGEFTLKLPDDFDYDSDDNLELVGSLVDQARTVAGAL